MDALKTIPLALITQSVHDAEMTMTRLDLGLSLAFYEKSEREDIFRHVNFEVTESNLEWIDNMTWSMPLLRCLR